MSKKQRIAVWVALALIAVLLLLRIMLSPYLTAWLGPLRTDLGNTIYKVTFSESRWKFYIRGIGNTLFMTLGAIVVGLFLGVLVAIIKVYHQSSGKLRALDWLANVYTTVIRGTPIIVQLLIIYYMLFSAVSARYAPLVAAFAFGVNSGAYVSETIRAGINSIDIGQTEAGRSLGLGQGMTMRLIVLPQAVRNILPALFNEVIMLLKETSVAGWIAVIDITRAGDIVRSRTLGFAPLLVSATIYLLLVMLLTKIQQLIERGLAASDRG